MSRQAKSPLDPLDNPLVPRAPTMAEQAIELAGKRERGVGREVEKLGEWGALNHALRTVPDIERTVSTKHPTVITYRFEDGSSAWRYASESTLRQGEDPCRRAVL
jgi:hypothetical protein